LPEGKSAHLQRRGKDLLRAKSLNKLARFASFRAVTGRLALRYAVKHQSVLAGATQALSALQKRPRNVNGILRNNALAKDAPFNYF